MYDYFLPNELYLPKHKPLTAVARARKWFYAMMILNMFWFTEELPHDLNTEFEYLLNPDWPLSPELPETIREIMDMTESEQEFICRKMKQPAWSLAPNVLCGKTILRHADPRITARMK